VSMLGSSRCAWALSLLQSDLLASDKRRARFTAMVPADLAGSTLRLIRQNACRVAGEQNCKWWRLEEVQDFPDASTVKVVRQRHPNTEYTIQKKGNDNVQACRHNSCDGCVRPRVSLREVSQGLFDEYRGDPKEDTSSLRDWMGSKRGMSHDTYKQMIVNALHKKWLTLSQANMLLLDGMALDATARGMMAVLRKLRRRPATKASSLEELAQSITLDDEFTQICLAEYEKLDRVAMNRVKVVVMDRDLEADEKEWLLN